MNKFKLVSDFIVTGDQPDALNQVVDGLNKGMKSQTLMGVTGSGKTFTVANVIEKIQAPTLVIAHNKTLAAQLATEFKEFFPENAVEYFVSYYDYYQPEAYLPSTDVYIEKDADINDQLDQLRHSATRALLSRRDVLIVASVSCIFGLGSPEEYQSFVVNIKKSELFSRKQLIKNLIDMQYERNDYDLSRGRFRVRGDTLDILPVYEDEEGVKIEFWGDEVERITKMDPLTGELLGEVELVDIYPAKHFVTAEDKLKAAIESIEIELDQRLIELKKDAKLLEAQRLESRTRYDLEMLKESGYCSGVENYSRHLSQRQPNSVPYTLMDYFPEDFVLFVDESHMTLPQIRAMYGGDRSRKEVLVDHGFRLPSALDNRPLNFEEFIASTNQVVFVSATPGPYENQQSSQTVEQVIRPTGLADPEIEVKGTIDQIDDLLREIKVRIAKSERCLVTTLTKRMAEELAEYLIEMGIKTHYLHSEIKTFERSEILRDLRLGLYDVIVGINLLREGLDLPEVSLVAILDADKEGYLRSHTALIQTIGRAARHIEGKVIMYADKITRSMQKAIEETERRRNKQNDYNKKRGITPRSISKTIHDITERISDAMSTEIDEKDVVNVNVENVDKLIVDLEKQMKRSSEDLEFEKAAIIRDKIIEIKKLKQQQNTETIDIVMQ
ncbi:MAG: excinuclease ABC subunit UvrB [SAR202 cluster bacterium]|nr:excinuclease ABC subunit UvrB [SAR202 cluster bacterium]|tara:strand:- start:13664 stop:15673 length:2010 start_codon:yes stop_codon:yes gene_type:complete